MWPLPDQTAAQRAAFAEGAQIGTSYAALAFFCAMFTSATLIRKAAFESVGGYDESLDAYEDWDLYLRLSLKWRLSDFKRSSRPRCCSPPMVFGGARSRIGAPSLRNSVP